MHTHIHTEKIGSEIWLPYLWPISLFVKQLRPKVGLGGYDILFAYFGIEAKSKKDFMALEGCLPETKF